MEILFLEEYAPLLLRQCPIAYVLYTIFDRFKDDSNRVFLKKEDISRHLDLDTLEESIATLQQLGLIEDRDGAIQLLEPKHLASSLVQSDVLHKSITDFPIPKEYQVLLEKEKLYEALLALGEVNFTASRLIDFFSLDQRVFKFILETKPKFKEDLLRLQKEVKSFSEKQKITTTTKSRTVKPPKKTSEEYNTMLKRAYKDRKGQDIPEDQFRHPQFLLKFVELYEKQYGMEYRWTADPYKSRESKDILTIMSALNNESLIVLQYLEWAFRIKAPTLNGTLGTGLLANPRMINDFNLFNKNSVQKSNQNQSDLVIDNEVPWD